MSEMTRLIFNVVVVGCWMAVLALAVLWVRSYWVWDRYGVATASGEVEVGSFRGGALLAVTRNPADGSARVNARPGYSAKLADPLPAGGLFAPKWWLGGFSHDHVNFFGVVIWSVTIPYWALIALFLILPAERWRRRMIARRRHRGFEVAEAGKGHSG
jgi:hypothetical protein